MSYNVIICTTPNKKLATKIATKLVKNKLAACVNIQESITSIYEWEGEVCKDSEVLMIIKTKKSLFKKVKKSIKSLHSYDVPEIISIKIEEGNEEYLQWIENTTKDNKKCS